MSCERCTELERMLRDQEAAVVDLGEQLAGRELQLRKAGQIEVHLRRQLSESMEADAKSQEIRSVLNHWNAMHPKAKTPTGGKRFQTVRKALRLGYTVEQLKLALDGLQMLPFVGSTGRCATGRPDQRYDDIDHALKDEATIERFIRYAENPPPPVEETPVAAHRPSRPGPPVGQAIDRVLDRLDAVKACGLAKWTAKCPGHDDHHSSLSVALGDKGVVAHCHAGCDAARIADALGIPLNEWFDESPPTTKPAKRSGTPGPLPSLEHVEAWKNRLMGHTGLLDRLAVLRGWSPQALDRLWVGFDGERLTFPIHNEAGELVNVCRYAPNGKPKMLGLPHRERGLFPPVERTSGTVWVVEGEPDAITAATIGLEAVAVPGANGWRSEWAGRFLGRDVVIVPDCDAPGRGLADKVARSLAGVVASVRVVDLDADRFDGYDLSDAVRDGASLELLVAMAAR